MGFDIVSTGSFENTIKSLTKMQKINFQSILEACGQMGVNALTAATPIDTGQAAHAWRYQVTGSGEGITIDWLNGDIEGGGTFNVVISLQYGYTTGTGGYVAGRDFINPAMKPIFDQIADRVWAEVIRA